MEITSFDFCQNKMMGKQIKPNIQIQNIIDSSNEYYLNLLGYKTEQTSLQQVPKNQWDEFTLTRNLNPNSSGIYLPRNQTAIIQEENPLSLFHEYFGHGLYCEQSLQGRQLVNLEKKLLEEEKQEFSKGKFTLEDVQRFRGGNQTFKKLDEFRKQNLLQYETFAIWTEYLLSKEHELKDGFERKYNSLKNQEKGLVDSIINFSESYGNLATFYESGLSRRTTPERIRKLLEEVYGNKAVNDSKLILLTGSKKPFSDIDLFASSNYLSPTKNNWLDLVSFNEQDFEKRIRLFEIQITHPIMVGEFITGDKNYLEEKKKQLKRQPITQEAIKHNLKKSKLNRDYAKKCTKNSNKERASLSYAQSYKRNAELLTEGDRSGLILKSETMIFNDLKGGKENNAT